MPGMKWSIIHTGTHDFLPAIRSKCLSAQPLVKILALFFSHKPCYTCAFNEQKMYPICVVSLELGERGGDGRERIAMPVGDTYQVVFLLLSIRDIQAVWLYNGSEMKWTLWSSGGMRMLGFGLGVAAVIWIFGGIMFKRTKSFMWFGKSECFLCWSFLCMLLIHVHCL